MGQKTTLCLVRHGETDWNAARRLQGRSDVALNEAGRRQAELTGRHLNASHWDAIVSSPLSRTLDSAKIIAAFISTPPPIEMPGLIERAYGDSVGLTREQSAQRWPDGVVPGMEPRHDLVRRVEESLSFLAETYRGRRVVVVSHGAFINAALALISNGEVGSGKTFLKNACVSIVHLDADGLWQIESCNSVEHLR